VEARRKTRNYVRLWRVSLPLSSNPRCEPSASDEVSAVGDSASCPKSGGDVSSVGQFMLGYAVGKRSFVVGAESGHSL